MQDLTYRQQKIQEKRKQTSFRDFVREICSWYPLNIYNIEGMLTRYPNTERKGNIVNDKYVSMNNELIGTYTGNFFSDLQQFYNQSKKSAFLAQWTNENSLYTDGIYGVKNGYLSFNIGLGVENCLYSVFSLINCSNIINSLCITMNSDNIFESKNIRQSFNIFYSANVDNSSDLRFCRDMIGCHNCIDCDNLINQSYCINNIQLTKEEYKIKRENLLKQKNMFPQVKTNVFAQMGNLNALNSSGRGIVNSENIKNGYFVLNAKDSQNIILFEWWEKGSSNFYDGIDIGINSTDFYATVQLWTDSEQMYCSMFGGTKSSHCYYSMHLEACSFCLWCIGIKNKSYCIFNKQYTKEERYAKVDKIFSQMEKDWTLWAFFPATMNPFYFNDTAAYLIDPTFTKEEVEAKGYLWRDEPIKVDIPANAELVKTTELDKYEGFDENGKRSINDEILKKVIVDENGNMWRIVNMEYDFLVKYGLPLPRKHWLDRMKENFKIG